MTKTTRLTSQTTSKSQARKTTGLWQYSIVSEKRSLKAVDCIMRMVSKKGFTVHVFRRFVENSRTKMNREEIWIEIMFCLVYILSSLFTNTFNLFFRFFQGPSYSTGVNPDFNQSFAYLSADLGNDKESSQREVVYLFRKKGLFWIQFLTKYEYLRPCSRYFEKPAFSLLSHDVFYNIKNNCRILATPNLSFAKALNLEFCLMVKI